MKCEICGRNIAQKINTGTVCKKCLAQQGFKFCPGCKKLLSFSSYHKNSHMSHGYNCRCKQCRSKSNCYKYNKQRFCKKCSIEIGKGKHFCSDCKPVHIHKSVHRKIIEDAGFILPKNCVIHHINSSHNDNRLENLYVFKSQSAHSTHHQKLAKWAARFPFMTNDEARITYPKLTSNLKNL